MRLPPLLLSIRALDCQGSSLAVNFKLQSGRTAVLRAVSATKGAQDCVELLLQRGADLEELTPVSWTPSGHAFLIGRSAATELCCKLGMRHHVCASSCEHESRRLAPTP